MTGHTALYARVSTDDQSLARQKGLNKLARGAEDGRLYPSEYTHEDVVQLADLLGERVDEHRRHLATETRLSDREAEAVALSEAGLTHAAIALVMSVSNSSPADTVSKSTADEYMRRAREKYLIAQRTESYLRDTFSTSGEPITPSSSSERVPVTIGERTFPAIEYVGPDEEKPGAMDPGEIFFTFDTDELLETNEAGALSMVTPEDTTDEIQTPDGTFEGHVVDVGVGGGGNVGVFVDSIVIRDLIEEVEEE